MPKRVDYTLSDDEIVIIETAIDKHADLRVRERARIVRLLHLGHAQKETAHLLKMSVGKVNYWYKRWKEEGIEGLADKSRDGRPRITDEAYEKLLAKTIETDPQTLGFKFTVWGVETLRAYMYQQTGIQVHANTLRNRLAEMDYVYRRPKHDLNGLHDETTRERAVEVIEMLKKSQKKEKSTSSLWMKQP